MSKKKNTQSFEISYRRLEKILELLGSENITLEETMNLFEEGLALTRECYGILNTAELRIKEISKSQNNKIEIKNYKPKNA